MARMVLLDYGFDIWVDGKSRNGIDYTGGMKEMDRSKEPEGNG